MRLVRACAHRLISMEGVSAMVELPIIEVERFVRDAGAQRVTEAAGRKMARLLEERAELIIEKAKMIANYAGRKTITRKDIMLALEFA